MPGEAPAPGYNPPPAQGYNAPPQGYNPPPAPGYNQPPPGYGPPPGGGYVPGPAGPPPPGYASSDDKMWALVAHFGGAAGMVLGGGAGGWVAPLVALLVQGPKSPVVRAHAIAALNFQITWSIVGFLGLATSCFLFGLFIWPIALLVGGICGIMAGIKANEGQFFTYPMSLSLIK